MMPLPVHENYWEACFVLTAGAETYAQDCAQSVSNEVAERAVDNIVRNPEIVPYLTGWASETIPLQGDLTAQNAAAAHAVATIDAELARRQ